MFKKTLRTLSLWIVPAIGMLLIRFIYLTCKKRFHLPHTIPNEPVIFAFWHADLLMQPYLYYKFRSIPKAKVLISEHFDGKIISAVIHFLDLNDSGFDYSRGAKVLIQGLKFLEEGYDIGITPDGPKGPRYTIANGIVVMAQKRNTKVIVFHCCPSRYWQLSSWDKFVIPKPFSVLDYYASEPISLEGFELDEAKEILSTKLMEHAIL